MLTPAGSGNLSNENEYTSHKHILNKSFNRWQSLTLSFSFVFSEAMFLLVEGQKQTKQQGHVN